MKGCLTKLRLDNRRMNSHGRLPWATWLLIPIIFGYSEAYADQDSIWIGGCSRPVVFQRIGALSKLGPASLTELEAIGPAFSGRAQKLDAAFLSADRRLVLTYSHLVEPLPLVAARDFASDLDLLKPLLREAVAMELASPPPGVTDLKSGPIRETETRFSVYTQLKREVVGGTEDVESGDLWAQVAGCLVKVTLMQRGADRRIEGIREMLETVLPEERTE